MEPASGNRGDGLSGKNAAHIRRPRRKSIIRCAEAELPIVIVPPTVNCPVRTQSNNMSETRSDHGHKLAREKTAGVYCHWRHPGCGRAVAQLAPRVETPS